jgi:hypothetical protein
MNSFAQFFNSLAIEDFQPPKLVDSLRTLLPRTSFKSSIKYEIPSGSLNLVLLETHRPNTLDKKNPLLFPWSLMLHQLQNFAPSNSLNTTFLVEFSILTITFKLREVFLLVGEKKRVMREYMKNMWISIRWYIWCAKNRVSLDSFSMKKTNTSWIYS